MTTAEKVKQIIEFLKENDFGYAVYERYTENEIEMEINWGDWKHDHMRANYLVREALKGERVWISWNEHITEQDGSDCYSAIHVWKFFEY